MQIKRLTLTICAILLPLFVAACSASDPPGGGTPVANAGPDQGSKSPGAHITLDGSNSFDPNGGLLTYSWAFTFKPSGSTAVLSNPTSVSPTFTLDKPGDYDVRLIVNDGAASSAPDTVTITTGNVAPVANAGPDQGGKLPGDLITLNGSGSSDANGDTITYNWSFVSKPPGSRATLAGATTASPTFIVDRVNDDYVVQLIVNDGTVDSAPDTVTISPGNVPPVADAGPDQGGKLPGARITLDGSGSFDDNGDPLTFNWAFTSIPLGSAAVLSNTAAVRPTFTVDRDGDYVVRLIVNDGALDSAPDSVIITSVNVAPVANAGPNQGGKRRGDLVTLDGSGSFDDNGDPLTFSWAFTSRPPGSAAVLNNPTSVRPTFTVDRDGNYVVRLIVNDGTVDSAPDTVTVTSDNVAPVADAGPDQGGKLPGARITLDGSGSSDDNGDPLTFNWAFTSIPLGSAAVLSDTAAERPTFTVDRDGDYVVRLIVNDGTVDSAPDSVIITSVNVAPVARAGDDQGGKLPGDLITLDGSGSSDDNGDPLTFRWSLSRPDGSAAVLSSTTSVSPTFTVDRAGSYIAQLIVNDGTVDSAPDSVTITTINVAPVANAGPDQVGQTVLSLITLDGSASADANGDPLTYTWTILSKPLLSLAELSDPAAVRPTFTIDSPGDYVVQLIVNDGTVDSVPDTVTITTN